MTCDTDEHRHSTVGNNNYCHDDHTCPTGQVLYDHDQCRAVPPPQCTPSTGEHQHTITNLNRAYCHDDHTCPTGQHLSGHDTCNDDHTCPTGQVLHNHDQCRTPPPPVEVSPPGSVSGLKCTAATNNSLTVGWDGVVGADRFEVQATSLPAGLLAALWETGGRPSGDGSAHTFASLGRGHVFLLGVRAVNSQGEGPEATVKCRTTPIDILSVECTANGLLVARFGDPFEGTGLAPTDYTAQITIAGGAQNIMRQTQQKIVFYTGAEYGAQYTETDTVTCPAHTDNWNSPNFYDPDEDCNDDTPLVGWLSNTLCRIGESKQMEYGLFAN